MSIVFSIQHFLTGLQNFKSLNDELRSMTSLFYSTKILLEN